MGMYNQIVEVESNVVKITTGGLEKEYNKTDLKCSATDIMVFLYYYTDSKNQIVASWNAYQADLYGYTLSSLKSYIDGLLSSSKANLSNINLGSVGEFATQADAIAGGLKNGDVYRLPKNADNRMLAIVNAIIESYTAGTSTIDFTNKGGDDWDIDFKIAMTSPQLPSGCTAPNYDVNVYFYLSGTGTSIDTNTGVTVDKTVNASGNGAGVYVAQQVYNILDSNLSNAGIIAISSLFKVNASGTLLAYFICNGVVVNSVNGLVINVTADINQSENYDIEWYSYDSSFNPTLIGTGLTANLTLPTDCAYLIAQPILDSVFTVDFPNQSTNISTVTIN